MHDMEPEPNNLSLINHSLHRIMRVCVLVLLGLLGVHAASWPSIPTSYTATVSANFHNSQPGNYYTLAYTEAYDSATQSFMSKGRFGSSNQVEYIFGQSEVYFSFDQRSPTTSCTFMSWSSSAVPSNITRFYQPSNTFFTMLYTQGLSPSSNLTYVGVTEEARFIPSDKWTLTMTMGPRQYNVTAYFAVNTDATTDQVPVRVELISASNPSYIVNHTYDWINFVSGTPPSLLYTVPANCQPGTWAGSNQPRGRLVSNNLYVSATNASSMPQLPQQFTALLEAKLHGSSDLNQIYTVQWTVDVPNMLSRFDYYEHSNASNYKSPILLSTFVYQYVPGSAWGTMGVSYSAQYNSTTRVYSNCRGFAGTFDASTASPLVKLRSGSLPSIFSNPAAFFNPAATFNGSEYARGVWADKFVSSHSVNSATDNTKYTFDTAVYFFPLGWAFPGRGVNESSQLPLRITNSGNLTNASGTFPFFDIVDMFQLVPAQPLPSAFDPSALGCAALPLPSLVPTLAPAPQPAPTAAPTENSLGLTAGIIIGVVFTILISAFVWWVWRRIIAYRQSQQMESADDDTPSSDKIPLTPRKMSANRV